MANPPLAAVIRASRAAIAAMRGPDIERYAIPLDFPRLFKWSPGDQSTIDGLTVLGASGGTIGRWLLIRTNDQGADLADGDATIQVGDGSKRVLPAATLTGNHSLTLGVTNAVLGDEIELTRLDATANTYAILNGGIGAGTLCTFPASQRWWARFRFDGANFALRAGGQLPS